MPTAPQLPCSCGDTALLAPCSVSTALSSHTPCAGKILTASDLPQERKSDTTPMTSFSFDTLIQNIQWLTKELSERDRPLCTHSTGPHQLSKFLGIIWSFEGCSVPDTVKKRLLTLSMPSTLAQHLLGLWIQGNTFLIYRFYICPFRLTCKLTHFEWESLKSKALESVQNKAKSCSQFPPYAIRVTTSVCILSPSRDGGSHKHSACAHFALGHGSSVLQGNPKTHVWSISIRSLDGTHIQR